MAYEYDFFEEYENRQQETDLDLYMKRVYDMAPVQMNGDSRDAYNQYGFCNDVLAFDYSIAPLYSTKYYYLPWDVHMHCYNAQLNREMSPERIADHGGYNETELDYIIPDWRKFLMAFDSKQKIFHYEAYNDEEIPKDIQDQIDKK